MSNGRMEYWNTGMMGKWKNANPVTCDACPACLVGKNDRIGVKFEAQKYFTGVGAISTVEEWEEKTLTKEEFEQMDKLYYKTENELIQLIKSLQEKMMESNLDDTF